MWWFGHSTSILLALSGTVVGLAHPSDMSSFRIETILCNLESRPAEHAGVVVVLFECRRLLSVALLLQSFDPPTFNTLIGFLLFDPFETFFFGNLSDYPLRLKKAFPVLGEYRIPPSLFVHRIEDQTFFLIR